MIFADNRMFGVVSDHFLNSRYIGYALLGSIKTSLGLTPSDSTGIDSTKRLAFIKAYHEHLERKKMGFHVGNMDNIESVNYLNKKINYMKKYFFGYGDNTLYGHIDTTGTAAGLSSNNLISSVMLEVIEKNEMLLFWYLKKGHYIKKDNLLIDKINRIGFSSELVEVFSSQELSNHYTFFVVLISKGKFVASGAGISEDSVKALDKALFEARLLEWQNRSNSLSSIYNLSDTTHKEILDYIYLLKQRLQCKVFVKETVKKLVLKKWITSIDICVLNSYNDWDSLTVKCVSKELFNCLPLKKNIRNNLTSKKIAQVYSLNENLLNKAPDCILL